MLAPILFSLTLAVAAPAEDWTPFYAFVGTWSGTRTGGSAVARVTRDYELIDGSRRLLISEGPASNRSPWGLVSVDPVRGGFELRRLGPMDGPSDLVLTEMSNAGARLVFETAPGSGLESVRITDERHGPDEFVERIEARSSGGQLTVVSETQFRRKR